MKPDELTQALSTILSHMGFDPTQTPIEITEVDGGVHIQVNPAEEEIGAMIGYRGEIIDSLQIITNLIYNNGNTDWQRVHLNIGDYRQNREASVIEIADKAAATAVETGKEVILSYLPSSERRLVHLHLENNDKVETYSEGQGKYRRLIVKPANQSHDTNH